jgi:hypothetical protein
MMAEAGELKVQGLGYSSKTLSQKINKLTVE